MDSVVTARESAYPYVPYTSVVRAKLYASKGGGFSEEVGMKMGLATASTFQSGTSNTGIT